MSGKNRGILKLSVSGNLVNWSSGHLRRCCLELGRSDLTAPQGKIRSGGYKKFSFCTQLSMKFSLLINVKMPT